MYIYTYMYMRICMCCIYSVFRSADCRVSQRVRFVAGMQDDAQIPGVCAGWASENRFP